MKIETPSRDHLNNAADPKTDTSSVVSQLPEKKLEIKSPEVIQSKKKPTVAIAITVTKDGNFVDGALVLGYSAKKYHSFEKGYPSAYGFI